MDTNLTEYLFQQPSLVPYVESYVSKICENLDTVYPKQRSECFRFALKGQNAIKYNTDSLYASSKGSLKQFLKTIKLPLISYEMVININPRFNQVDYERVLIHICENIFNSGYRILHGKSIENFIKKNPEKFVPDKKLTVWESPCMLRQKPKQKHLWLSKNESVCTSYNSFFGFWEETDTNTFLSTKETCVQFTLDTSRKKTYIFTLDVTYLHIPSNEIRYGTLLKIEIPTYQNKHSRPIMWRELNDTTFHGNIPISNFLYNTIDTNKPNLRILLKLLNVYHESLNIFTMERLSGIPRTQVLLYENGQRDDLLSWLKKWTYADESILIKYDTNHLKQLAVILQKKYTSHLYNEKYKIIISLYIDGNSDSIDQLEISLDLLFNKSMYYYFLRFVKQNVNHIIFQFIRHTKQIISRRSFLIPKLMFSNYWNNTEINYPQVYEYNMIYFGNKKEEVTRDLLDRLSTINFDQIQESYNCKIVPAMKSDIIKGEKLSHNFLYKEEKNYIIIYFVLLVNHVQKLYRIPIQLIKLKFVPGDMPSETQKLHYNSQDIFISDQDVFLETLVETSSLSEVVNSLLFMQTLTSDKIDYKIRHKVIPDLKIKNIDEIITYKNMKNSSLNEILKKLGEA